jgi:hypothetical protein
MLISIIERGVPSYLPARQRKHLEIDIEMANIHKTQNQQGLVIGESSSLKSKGIIISEQTLVDPDDNGEGTSGPKSKKGKGKDLDREEPWTKEG